MNKFESKYFNTARKMDEALIELLQNKEFPYISIKEICETAGVNRSTFYLHYENTSDLLKETIQFMLDNFLSYFSVEADDIPQRFEHCSPQDLIFITPDYLLPYLTYIQENRIVFQTALRHPDFMNFEQIYQRLFQHIFDPILERFQYPPSDRSYVMAFYLNGIIAIVTEWLKQDCKDSTEHICQVIRKCITGH